MIGIGGINSVQLTARSWWIFAISILIMLSAMFAAGYKTGEVTACGHREPFFIATPGGGYEFLYPKELNSHPVTGKFGMQYIDENRDDANIIIGLRGD